MDPPPGAAVQRFFGHTGQTRSMKKEFDSKRRARYGYTWRGIVRQNDREMGIAGGELIVLDLETGEILGVRRNYKQSRGLNWLAARSCAQLAVRDGAGKPIRVQRNDEFVMKILVPRSKTSPQAR